MQTVWCLFQDYGTGGLASAGWIRAGTIDAGVFAWAGAAIPTPSHIWAYVPNGAYTGYLAVDPLDPTKIWVSYLENTGGVFHNRAWLYDSVALTWTSLMNTALIGPTAPFCVDMTFDVDGTCFMAIGGDGARGGSGGVGEGGVYRSLARGAFTYRGSGFDHGPNSGNINNPVSLTGLTIIPTSEVGTRVLVVSHTLARSSGAQTTGWVVSRSADDGASWHDPVPTYNGNQFQLEAFAMVRIGGNTGGLFYAADHSGSGAYSTSFLSSTIGADPVDGPTGLYGAGIEDSGSIAHTFATDPNKAVAYPTAFATTLYLYNSANGGSTWNRQTQGLGFAPFAYRGARTSRDSLVTAGITEGTSGHLSYLLWSEDAGATWHNALAESEAHGLSLDFGPATVVTPRVLLETLTFRDSRMFVGQTRYYVAADSDAEAEANALGIADALQLLSDGAWTGAVGPYTTPAGAPTPGSDATYQNAEMVIRLTWLTDDGVAIGVDVPCPATALFISDQESISLLNPDLSGAATAGLTYKLCTRGGLRAVSFVGATRIMRGFRSTETIRTLDPAETNTAE